MSATLFCAGCGRYYTLCACDDPFEPPVKEIGRVRKVAELNEQYVKWLERELERLRGELELIERIAKNARLLVTLDD